MSEGLQGKKRILLPQNLDVDDRVKASPGADEQLVHSYCKPEGANNEKLVNCKDKRRRLTIKDKNVLCDLSRLHGQQLYDCKLQHCDRL